MHVPIAELFIDFICGLHTDVRLPGRLCWQSR